MATLKKILEAARLIERSDAETSAPAPAGDADIDAIIRRGAEAETAPYARDDAPVGAAVVGEAIGQQNRLEYTLIRDQGKWLVLARLLRSSSAEAGS